MITVQNFLMAAIASFLLNTTAWAATHPSQCHYDSSGILQCYCPGDGGGSSCSTANPLGCGHSMRLQLNIDNDPLQSQADTQEPVIINRGAACCSWGHGEPIPGCMPGC